MISKPVVAALTLAPLLITFFLRRKINDISNNYDNSYYKCKFISVTMNSECRQHIYDKVPCYAGCSLILLNEIIDFVSSATKSVSVCMYLLTSYEICNVILNCHTSGKQVRVIADERMWGCTGSQARILQRHGDYCALNFMKFLLIMKCMFQAFKLKHKRAMEVCCIINSF